MKNNLEQYYKNRFLIEATEKQEANQKFAEDKEKLRELRDKVQKAVEFYQGLLDKNAPDTETKEAALQLKQVKAEFQKLKASIELQRMHKTGEIKGEVKENNLIYDPAGQEEPEEAPKQSIKAEDYQPKDKLDYISTTAYGMVGIFEDGEFMEPWMKKIINQAFAGFQKIEKFIKNNQEPDNDAEPKGEE